MSRRNALALAGIVLVALAARALFAGWVVGWHSAGRGDEVEFHLLAESLADGRGFVTASGEATARRAPGYPAMLSLVYRVVGPRQAAARALQVAMGGALVVLVFFLARRYFGSAAGWAAAALSALNPFLVFVSGYVLSENLYLLLFLAAFLCLPSPSSLGGAARRPLLAAAILALAALTRPTGVLLAVWVFAVALVLAGGRWRDRFARLGAAAAVFLVLTLPWMVRNAAALGGWVGMSTYGGVVLYQANNPKTLKIPNYRGGVAPLAGLPRHQELLALDERGRDSLGVDLARQFARHHWRRLPQMAWWKFKRFWRLHSDVGMSGIRSGWWFDPHTPLGRLAVRLDPGFLYAVVAFPLFVAGVVLTRSRWRELGFLYGVVVIHTLLAVVFFGSIRMRVPVEPVIALFAAEALSRAAGRLRRGRQGTTTPSPGPESA